ncbi:MAG: YkgJ family cysteine cluster protein [Polyangiales bacterium]
MADLFDCRRCGACCCNPDENRREGSVDWVEVGDHEPILKDEALARRLVVVNDKGERHLRLDDAGRCLALRGKVGKRVECTVYALRADGCRKVASGSAMCLQYRAERGVMR